MPWLSILQGLVSLTSALAVFVRDKRLMKAGEANFIIGQMGEVNGLLVKARAARRSANDDGVMSDDSFRRKRDGK